MDRASELAQLCGLSAETIDRYVPVGRLMLKSPVIACMLPSFVAQLLEPITLLLADDGDDGSFHRLQGAFSERAGGLALEGDNGDGNDDDDDGDGLFRKKGMLLLNAPPPLLQLAAPALDPVAVGVDRLPPRHCRKCNTATVRFRCSMANCHTDVCWECVKYASDPFEVSFVYPGNDHNAATMGIYMFCGKHLPKVDLLTRKYGLYTQKAAGRPMTLANFCMDCQTEEAAQVVQLFSQPGRRFNLIPQPPDGWCSFHAVAFAMEIPFDGFIERLKGSVDSFLESLVKGIIEDEDEFRATWAALDPNDNESVQQFWSSDEGDLSLVMMSNCLGNVYIYVWQVRDRRLHMLQNLADQKGNVGGDGRRRQQIHLLKTNAIMPHTDLLVPVVDSLESTGFVVHRGAIAIDESMRSYFQSLPGDVSHAIFNNAPVDAPENDGKRSQVDFSLIEIHSLVAQQLLTTVKTKLAQLAPHYLVAGATVLHSEPGCLAQLAHIDYPPPNPDADHAQERRTLPLGCVVALMDDTCVDVWPAAAGYEFPEGAQFDCHHVLLSAGDVLMFRGDLVHGGAASDSENVRLHCYLEPADGSFRRQQDADGSELTHFMDDCAAILPRR